MMNTNNKNVVRIEDELHIFALNHPSAVTDFIYALHNGIERGYQDFKILFRPNLRGAFPNACTPIAGLIEYYSQQNISFEVPELPSFIQSIQLFSPLQVVENQSALLQAPLNRIWRFENSEDINKLVDGFIDEIYKQAVCQLGVIEGLTWCLSEVMDNVLQHSFVSCGYVMGQIHRTNKHIAFCIFDPGQGIFNSLKPSKHSPRNPVDAITMAIREGVTRDTKIGQGNGMWGLHSIVKANSGVLVITSNSASYMLKGDEIKTFSKLPVISQQLGTTTIDFQINYQKGISLAEALGGYTPVNLRLEALEDERGNILYKLSEKASGTGTRQSGERIRNEVINLYQESQRAIELDFSGVSVISSSFADELVGKLIISYGLFGFMKIFRLNNMNEIVQSVVNRSVAQRMANTFTVPES